MIIKQNVPSGVRAVKKIQCKFHILIKAVFNEITLSNNLGY